MTNGQKTFAARANRLMTALRELLESVAFRVLVAQGGHDRRIDPVGRLRRIGGL